MRRLLLILVVAMFAIGGAFAQKGQMGVGADFSVSPWLHGFPNVVNMGVGVKLQYGFTDALRADMDIDYLFKSKRYDQFDIIVNVHYLVGIDGFSTAKVYPIAGIGYARTKASGVPWPLDCDRLIFNVGLGVEGHFTDRMKWFMEVKYQYAADYQKVPIQVGVAYVF